MSRLRAAAQTDKQAAGMCIPVRRAEADESGYKDDTIGVSYRLGKRFHFRRCANQLQIVAQPLHNSAADKNASFKGVFKPAIEATYQCRDEAVVGRDKFVADVLKKKTSCAVSVFRIAWIEAQLPEECGLLIAC